MANTLAVLLCHTDNTSIHNVIHWWQQHTDIDDNILIAFGGLESEYNNITWKHKVFVDDPRLRTRDHQREKQSYQGVFKAAAAWKPIEGYDYIHFAEYDHLPLKRDLHNHYISILNEANAHVLGHDLKRIDSTNNPHCLYHLSNPDFAQFWQSISERSNPNQLYSFLGTGHFWQQQAFLHTASLPTSPSIYLELFMPTAAHHLGYKVVGHNASHHYISPRKDQSHCLDTAIKKGILTIHPIKQIPTPGEGSALMV